MNKTLSPRQVAQSIGASESSVKRWCDRGLVPFLRTGGGHRRIPLAGVLEFVRREKMSIVAPQAIGLPEQVGKISGSIEQAGATLKDLLVNGDEDASRILVWDLHIAGHPIATICDEVIVNAFEQIGDGWCDGSVEIYQERRSCEIARIVLSELRQATYSPAESSPLAMGATASNDPYGLPTMMVELVLRQNGWKASAIGTQIPFESLCQAIVKERPRLFWLSVSQIKDESLFVDGFNELQKVAGEQTAIVVGGRALTDDIRHRLNYTVYCDKLEHLARFAGTIYQPPPPEATKPPKPRNPANVADIPTDAPASDQGKPREQGDQEVVT